MGASAHRTGASLANVTVALVAGMIGSFFLPLFGGILLSLVALFALEYWRQRNWRSAFTSTKSMALGCGWAVVARFMIGLVMIGLYGAWVICGRSKLKYGSSRISQAIAGRSAMIEANG